MEYKKIELNNYNIHLINDERFHTTFLKVYFTENVTYEKITYRNFLADLLTCATKEYDTKSKLLKKCQDLYTMYPNSSSNRFGNLLVTKFSLCTLNSIYIDENNLKENILLLKEIVLNPLVNNNSFSKKYFEIVKKDLVNEIKSQKEDSRLYSNIRLLDILEPNKNKYYTLTGFSDIDIINKLDEKMLYECYLDMLKNSRIDIFISGKLKDQENIIDIIKNNFYFPDRKYILKDAFIKHNVESDKINFEEETILNNQSKLSIGIKAYNLQDFEIKYVLPIISMMLGGRFDSLLMKEVRENNSLAYYINCFYNKLDSILIINSGIDKDNYDKTIDLIKKVLNNLKEGKFKVSFLKQVINEYISDIELLKDNNNSLIDYRYGIDVFNSETLEKRIECIKTITKNDIMNVASKLLINAIFFLKGEL